MTWNYRVIRERDEDEEGGYAYSLCEACYNDGQELPKGVILYVELRSGTIDGLRQHIEKIPLALTKPIIEHTGKGFIEVEDNG